MAACGGAPPAPTVPPTPAPHVGATVQVRDNVFGPEVSTIAAGEAVEWRWSGQNPHNVTGDGYASPTRDSGVYVRSFERPGTYFYRCTIHTHMLGEVVVR
jgi:plastocyanin